MSRQILFVTVILWLSTAAAQSGLFNSIKDHVTNEISAIADPIQKTIVSVGFSQCRHVKRLLRVDYESYNNSEPNMNALKLDFVTRNVNVSYRLTAAAALIPQSGWFNPQRPLKIYLHGFTDNPSKGSFTSLSTAFLNQGDFNIVALDASSLISWMYLRSTTMVRFIGEELGKMMAALVSAGLNPSNIHLIGHSLGSHISGFAGHADFWPNSGSNQPSCLPALLLTTCSHSRAWEYFSESVSNPRAFSAVSCQDWQGFRTGTCNFNDLSLMGYATQTGKRGSYFLQTAGEAPFGLGMNGVQYVNNEGLVRNIGNTLG